MANINVRSPYLIRNYHADLASTTLKLWIYTGTQTTDTPATPTYTLTSSAINGETVFDISPLVKDYLDINFDGNYDSEIVWVDYTTQEDRYHVKDVYSSTMWYGEYNASTFSSPSHVSVLTPSSTFYYAKDDGLDYPISGEFLYTDLELKNQFIPDNLNYFVMLGASCSYASSFGINEGTGSVNITYASCGTSGDWVYVNNTADATDTGQDTIITLLEPESSLVQNTAFYGYGYFEEGVNPQNVKGLSNDIYNYIPYSNDFSQWSLGSNLSLVSGIDGNSDTQNNQITINTGGSNTQIELNLDENLPIGQEVTISVWYQNHSTSSVTTGTRNFQLGYYNGGSYVAGGDVTIDLSNITSYQILSYTFTVPELDTLSNPVTTPRIRLNGYGLGSTGEVFRLYNAALYLGSAYDGKMETNGSAGVFFEDKIAVKRSVNAIYKPENENFYLPVFANETKAGSNGGIIKFYKDGVEYSNSQYTIVSDQDESTDVVKYLDGFSDVSNVEVTFYLDSTFYYGANRFNIPVYNVCEPKYTPYKLTFINKYGVLEDLWFFKNSKLSLETKEESYRSNIVSSGSYSINDHQYKTLYKEGKESLTINSGFYPESHNEAFKQLLLSEQVWINYKGQTLPIKIKDSSISFKTQIQDKLINYTMNIEFAYDKINNVR